MERIEFLNWILELLDKLKSSNHEDGMLRIILPLCLQYLDEFVQSELLSRRLAHLCCKKLGQLALKGSALLKEEPNNSVNLQLTPGGNLMVGTSSANNSFNNINATRIGSNSNSVNNANGNSGTTPTNSTILNNLTNNGSNNQQNGKAGTINASANGNNVSTGINSNTNAISNNQQ